MGFIIHIGSKTYPEASEFDKAPRASTCQISLDSRVAYTLFSHLERACAEMPFLAVPQEMKYDGTRTIGAIKELQSGESPLCNSQKNLCKELESKITEYSHLLAPDLKSAVGLKEGDNVRDALKSIGALFKRMQTDASLANPKVCFRMEMSETAATLIMHISEYASLKLASNFLHEQNALDQAERSLPPTLVNISSPSQKKSLFHAVNVMRNVAHLALISLSHRDNPISYQRLVRLGQEVRKRSLESMSLSSLGKSPSLIVEQDIARPLQGKERTLLHEFPHHSAALPLSFPSFALHTSSTSPREDLVDFVLSAGESSLHGSPAKRSKLSGSSSGSSSVTVQEPLDEETLGIINDLERRLNVFSFEKLDQFFEWALAKQGEIQEIGEKICAELKTKAWETDLFQGDEKSSLLSQIFLVAKSGAEILNAYRYAMHVYCVRNDARIGEFEWIIQDQPLALCLARNPFLSEEDLQEILQVLKGSSSFVQQGLFPYTPLEVLIVYKRWGAIEFLFSRQKIDIRGIPLQDLSRMFYRLMSEDYDPGVEPFFYHLLEVILSKIAKDLSLPHPLLMSVIAHNDNVFQYILRKKKRPIVCSDWQLKAFEKLVRTSAKEYAQELAILGFVKGKQKEGFL